MRGLNASNARQGIKTGGEENGLVGGAERLNASNARQGIKTTPGPGPGPRDAVRLNASNARQGIKTDHAAQQSIHTFFLSERLQCPTGH